MCLLRGEQFVYDPIGNWNRYQKLEDGLGTLDQTRVHNTDNQITQVDAESKDLAYDAAGNMTRTPVGVAEIVWGYKTFIDPSDHRS